MNKLNVLSWMLMAFILSACSQPYIENTSQSTLTSQQASAQAANRSVAQSERLGTAWGDDISSHITQLNLGRLSNRPVGEAMLRYANKDYQGRAVNSISMAAGKISFAVVNDQGNVLPIYRVGEYYYLAGKAGQSYQLRYENHTAKTFEVVASVDGLDVLNGRSASRSHSGYVLRPYTTLAIEGFRKSQSAVASFTFSQPNDAYAANSSHGSIRNTGIIGSVIYELKAPEMQEQPKSQYAPAPNAFPAD